MSDRIATLMRLKSLAMTEQGIDDEPAEQVIAADYDRAENGFAEIEAMPKISGRSRFTS